MGADASKFSGPEVTDGQILEQLVLNEIQLSHEEKSRFGSAIDEIVQFLYAHDAKFPWHIKRVVKSGSLNRGTAGELHLQAREDPSIKEPRVS